MTRVGVDLLWGAKEYILASLKTISAHLHISPNLKPINQLINKPTPKSNSRTLKN